MLFKVNDIYKSYGVDDVLRGVSFQLNPGEKVGLVGRNGAGKTTIFRLITGEESAASGTIERINGLRIGLLEQHVDFTEAETVHTAALSAFEKLHDIEAEMRSLEVRMESKADDEILERYSDLQTEFEACGGFEYTARAESVLLGLGFGKETWKTDTKILSGGQKNRLGMVRLLLAENDILLLDEPTNHLDVAAVEWLESFLIQSDTAYIVISHDRYFLDRTCSRIIEIENGKSYSYTGNYSSYQEQAELRREQLKREYENQSAFIAKTEAFINKNLAGQKTKQAKSRRNMLARLERVDAPVKEIGGGSFNVRSVERTGTHVLTTDALTIGYGENRLANDIDLLLLRGEKLGIVGGNGSGKTTLLRTLLGENRPLAGTVTWGVKTRLGYYSQQLEELDPGNDVINEFRKVASLAENGEIRSFLARFLFFGDDVFKRVSDLSGGEKGRLSLSKLVYSNANVLLLDEPTNHLDIPSREALEAALLDYPGTIIVVTHDRYFLDRIADRILDLRGDGKVVLFNGNYTEYHGRQESLQSREELPKPGIADSGDAQCEPQKTGKILSKNAISRIKTRIGAIEETVPKLEEEISRISFDMALPENASDPATLAGLAQTLESKEKELTDIYEEWESLLADLP